MKYFSLTQTSSPRPIVSNLIKIESFDTHCDIFFLVLSRENKKPFKTMKLNST